jgi:hypothetical protein
VWDRTIPRFAICAHIADNKVGPQVCSALATAVRLVQIVPDGTWIRVSKDKPYLKTTWSRQDASHCQETQKGEVVSEHHWGIPTFTIMNNAFYNTHAMARGMPGPIAPLRGCACPDPLRQVPGVPRMDRTCHDVPRHVGRHSLGERHGPYGGGTLRLKARYVLERKVVRSSMVRK